MVITLPAEAEPREIKERFSRRIVRTLMGNFRSFSEALLELVDNAFDKFDGFHGGRTLRVHVEASRSKIVVENIGGRGMGFQDLENWLLWGQSDTEAGIGEYGQGGKAAMGYLGNAWQVQTKRWDESEMLEIKESQWREGDELKRYVVKSARAPQELDGLGYCRIEITSLRQKNQNIQRLWHQLGNAYRPLLKDGKVSITLNDQHVPPFELPIYDGVPISQIREKTQNGIFLTGWVGELKRDARQRTPISINGGMRVLRAGRLVCDGEFFGHPGPSYKQSLSRLIGEIEVSTHVPVLPNKTDFDRDSLEWNDIRVTMQKVLKPHIDRLLQQPDEVLVTREERKRVQKVRELMVLALKQLALQASGGTGRKDLEPNSNIQQNRQPDPNRRQKKRRKPRTGMPEWRIRPLDQSRRWDWDTERGRDGKPIEVLIINKSFPWYTERKGDELYIAETAPLPSFPRHPSPQQ